MKKTKVKKYPLTFLLLDVNKFESKEDTLLMSTLINKMSSSPHTHCSYLDIYISQKIRLCVVDLEGKVQTNVQAKLLNFLVWKFKLIILIFLLFFSEFVKSSV